MFGTAIWLNGSYVGEDIACYTSQEYDVTPFLREGENHLLVRVGNRSTLPAESAVGNDQERKVFIPGIWGDVRLERSGIPRISLIQVIPHIDDATAEVRLRLLNPSANALDAHVTVGVAEKRSGNLVGKREVEIEVVPLHTERTVVVHVPVAALHCWTPDDPFLYVCTVEVFRDSLPADCRSTVFGMREFKIEGGNFVLNGEKILLRGGNIAFHRFLSDDERAELPWDLEWVKRVLIDIPKEHNFNLFRAHIGQMYNRWYDVADEFGMLLQNEWQFWKTSGSREQTTKEFTRWIEDNVNHPSIVIWDPINESTDSVVQNEIVPLMKAIDPTRPWESVDFTEEHPYIYSLGPVLNDRKFGFTRALQDIAADVNPTMVNEFLWWWIDRDGNPTSLMEGVVERWLGPDWTSDELITYQGFLAGELVELFRRMGVDAIQPFVYLSNNAGPTAHWFQRNIRDLKPKPLLADLRNAFVPEGVSIELWDRHFFENEKRRARVFVFNDRTRPFSGILEWGVLNPDGTWVSRSSAAVKADPVSRTIVSQVFEMPRSPGEVTVMARLLSANRIQLSQSKKTGFVWPQPERTGKGNIVALFPTGDGNPPADFLARSGFSCSPMGSVSSSCKAAIVAEGTVEEFALLRNRDTLTEYVSGGGALILLEPEFGVHELLTVEILEGLELTIRYREDADRGGYDSAVFPVDKEHPVWNGIGVDQLKFFNGSLGGEIVSQHDVTSSLPATVHARSGLSLKTAALMEIPYGKGRVVVSRLQVRGRLGLTGGEGLYDRRPDPVAMQYFLNLIEAFSAHD